MAIRLGRGVTPSDNNEENNVKKTFEISGTVGSTYDLDSVVNSKSRISNTELITEVSNDNSTIGSITTRKAEDRIFANNLDAVNYLFENEPSTSAYTSSTTLRRPIILWSEGSEPTSGYNQEANSLYTEIERLNKMITDLENKLESKNMKADEINIDRKRYIKN